MTKQVLSELQVKNLPLPAKGQARYWDGGLPGFGVRVSQGGAKTWILLDPRSKTRTQETIGRYPLVSLQEARSEAKRRLAEVTLGRHKPRSISWDKAVAEYLEEVGKKRKARTLLYSLRRQLAQRTPHEAAGDRHFARDMLNRMARGMRRANLRSLVHPVHPDLDRLF